MGKKMLNQKRSETTSFGPFLWEKPNGIRQLQWKSQDTEEATLELIQDAYGNIAIGESEENKPLLGLFLDGRQRTLLITRLSELATNALQAKDLLGQKSLWRCQ